MINEPDSIEPAAPEPAPEQPQKKIPKYGVPRGLYFVTGAAVALSIFVTLFVRNPYSQSMEGGYYDKHPYDETSVWVLVLVIIPMIGLAAFIAWTRRKQSQ
jgi:phospholipase C